MVATGVAPLSWCFGFFAQAYGAVRILALSLRRPEYSSRNGDPMDAAGLSPDGDARSSVTHRSAGTRERHGRRSDTNAVRAESARQTQGPSRPAPAIERAAAPLAAAAPGPADQLQADYFVRLLAGQRGLIDQRIDEYLREIATAEAKGDVDAVAGFRRLVRVAEQDQRTVEDLAEKLCRRFARRAPTETPTGLPRRRLAVRR